MERREKTYIQIGADSLLTDDSHFIVTASSDGVENVLHRPNDVTGPKAIQSVQALSVILRDRLSGAIY